VDLWRDLMGGAGSGGRGIVAWRGEGKMSLCHIREVKDCARGFTVGGLSQGTGHLWLPLVLALSLYQLKRYVGYKCHWN
jgi:hypothetical protein